MCIFKLVYKIQALHFTFFFTHWSLENILYFALLVKKCRFNIFKHSISHILDGMGAGANGGGRAEQTPSKSGSATWNRKKSSTLVFTYSY